MITVTPHPRDWCAECGQSWGRDDIAITVAGVTICDKCAERVADVAMNGTGTASQRTQGIACTPSVRGTGAP